jgi:hypothetical protein
VSSSRPAASARRFIRAVSRVESYGERAPRGGWLGGRIFDYYHEPARQVIRLDLARREAAATRSPSPRAAGGVATVVAIVVIVIIIIIVDIVIIIVVIVIIIIVITIVVIVIVKIIVVIIRGSSRSVARPNERRKLDDAIQILRVAGFQHRDGTNVMTISE